MDKEAPPQPWFSRHKSLRYRLILRLSRWTHGRIRSPHYHSAKAFYREKDAQENASCRPRPEQKVETFGFWATEAYTPETATQLLSSLEKLKSSYRGLGDRDPASWVRRQRRRPGSSFYLYFSRPGAHGSLGSFEIELPSFAEAATAAVWSATPSLTLLTVAIELSSSERARIHELLHADHPTKITVNGNRSLSISGPDLERRRLVEEIRSKWIDEATLWFANHFPGFFTRAGEPVPTCELTVLTDIAPFPSGSTAGSEQNDHQLRDALRMSGGDVFVTPAQGDPAIFYAPFLDGADRRDCHSILAMTRSGFESIKADAWGDDQARFFWAYNDSARQIVAHWSIVRVLEKFSDRVWSTRDQFADLIGGSRATAALGKVRRHTAECTDAVTIAREVNRGVQDGLLGNHAEGFVLQDPFGSSEPREARTALRDILRSSTKRLSQDLTELNAALHSQAALLSAHANLRLQPLIMILAAVSMLAGVVAAIEPIKKILLSDRSTPTSTLPQPMVDHHHPYKQEGKQRFTRRMANAVGEIPARWRSPMGIRRPTSEFRPVSLPRGVRLHQRSRS